MSPIARPILAMKLFYTGMTVALIAIPAVAQPIQGPYVSGDAGITLPSSSSVSIPDTASEPNSANGPSAAASANAAINGDPGAVQSGSAGWGFGNGVRVELQGTHSQQSWGSSP